MARPCSPWLLTGMEPTACSFAAAPLLRPPAAASERPGRLRVLLDATDAVRALGAEWDGLPRAEQAQLEEAMVRLRELMRPLLDVGDESVSDWEQLD